MAPEVIRRARGTIAMETLKEIWAFLRVRKKFWLAPIIFALVLLGLLIAFAGQTSLLTPFVYML